MSGNFIWSYDLKLFIVVPETKWSKTNKALVPLQTHTGWSGDNSPDYVFGTNVSFKIKIKTP